MGAANEVGTLERPLLERIRSWAAVTEPDLPAEDAGDARSGAADGALVRHVGIPAAHATVARALTLLRALARGEAGDEDLYGFARTERTIDYADALVEDVALDARERTALRPHARWLLRTARHREPLKLGIVLVGLVGDERDVPDLITVARHEEFTLYAAGALGTVLADPIEAWLEIARSVSGWGKIEVVERIAVRARGNAVAERWLLTDGCANAVMDEYLALPCAEGGRLAAALETGVDEDVLDGACTIVSALAAGDPGPGLAAYRDGGPAVAMLIAELAGRCATVRRLAVVADVLEWIERADVDDTQRLAAGFDSDRLAAVVGSCQEILGRPGWDAEIHRALRSGSRLERAHAWRVATRVGVDPWDDGFASLTAGDDDDWLAFSLLQTDDAERARRTLEVLASRLPDGIAERALIFALRRLGTGDVRCDPLVAAGLASASALCRELAVRAADAASPPSADA